MTTANGQVLYLTERMSKNKQINARCVDVLVNASENVEIEQKSVKHWVKEENRK